MAIKFDKLLIVMEKKGVKKYHLRQQGINASALDRLFKDGYASTKLINKLCTILKCQPGAIMKYVSDKKPSKKRGRPRRVADKDEQMSLFEK